MNSGIGATQRVEEGLRKASQIEMEIATLEQVISILEKQFSIMATRIEPILQHVPRNPETEKRTEESLCPLAERIRVQRCRLGELGNAVRELTEIIQL